MTFLAPFLSGIGRGGVLLYRAFAVPACLPHCPSPLRLPALIVLGLPLALEPALAVDFVREVQPLFERHCVACHGAEKQKGGLRLDVKAAALKGGDHEGPDIVAGKPDQSPLLQRLASTDPERRMPPKGERLNPSQQAMLRDWIAQGAPWPEGVDKAKLADRRDHWSFKPLARVQAPTDGSALGPSRPAALDALVEQELKARGLERSPPADAATWLRRVTLDLTGLLPDAAQVEAFVAKPDKAAVVERLLASPRYGERWAQHWLDVVRYADTHGFEVNTERPHAWPYRDWVIRAINADLPYDQFIRQQLAGDALGADEATGFLVTASVLLPGQIGKDAPSIRLARQDSLDEMVINIGQTFMGLSLGCARCHDHKFDPITARDYYSMQAFVAGVEYADREMRTPQALAARAAAAKARQREQEIAARLAELSPLAQPGKPVAVKRPGLRAGLNVDRVQPRLTQRLRFTILRTNSLEPCIDELEVFNREGRNVALASAGAKLRTSGDRISRHRHEPGYLHDGRYGNESSWMSSQRGTGWVELEFAKPEQILRVHWSRDRLGKLEDRLALSYRIEVQGAKGWELVADHSDRREVIAGEGPGPEFVSEGLEPAQAKAMRQLLNERGSLAATMRAAEQGMLAFAGSFRQPDVIAVLARGDPEQPRETVGPAVPAAFGDLQLPSKAAEQERRLALGQWLARADHPLTARVMVNRLWQGHFGLGLVGTPSDFGHMGLPPSHPALLDWLAAEFIRSGWSLKHMHRLMLLSETYGQRGMGLLESEAARRAAAQDGEGKWLWRYGSRRLEAEAIRDCMLQVAGVLNLQMHGRGFDLFDKRGGLSGFAPVEQITAVNSRRMIYAHKVRREPEAVFGAFDCPDAGQSASLRRSSTTPIQALNLFNSPFTLQLSLAFAKRVQSEVGADPRAQIRRAYALALTRTPSSAELEEALPLVREHGLAPLCRALYNSNEFLFLP